MPLFTIPCSFGEIIDKITILEIKMTKASGSQKANIQAEYDGLKSHLCPDLNPEKMTIFTKSLDELRSINKRLWTLEDLIRQKSRMKAHDSAFIQLAEAIHMTNDQRYRVKRVLNSLMESILVEEKIYSPPPEINIQTSEDQAYFGRAMRAFEKADYETSFRIFEKLCEKYKEAPASLFLCSLLSSYDTNAAFLGVPNQYQSLLDRILPLARDIVEDSAHSKHILMNYGMHLMRRKEYSKATEYLRFMNAVTAPGISPETMSFPPDGSTGATLLVYMGGGIGDKIMFARFIPVLCEVLKENTVVFLVDDSLHWIFSQVFSEPNLRVVPFSMRSTVVFTHHCNIHMVHHWLGLEYEDILPLEYLRVLPIQSPIQITKTKKTVLINWHGNYANQLERLNRGVALEQLTPLLAIKDIQWVSTQKEFSPDEADILKKYRVLNLGPLVDKGGDSYKDTLAVMRQVDLVISTDTSFVHVAGTAGIPCWVLLTKGCEWRWTQDKTTRWYPNLRLFRQTKVGSWSSVVSEVKGALGEA